MKSATKKIFRLAIWAAALGIIAIAACYIAVSVNAWGRTYDDASLIPHRTIYVQHGVFYYHFVTPHSRHNSQPNGSMAWTKRRISRERI